jgi:CheY-like chemotaxis protein
MEQTNTAEGRLLLLVDDDDNARTILASTIAARGYRVLECATGLEAVASLQAGELPDLILLDLHMPVMDGWEFRVWLLQRNECAHIPLIVLSGDRSAKARALRADAFLPKPLSLEAVLQTVDSLLSRRQSDALDQYMWHLGRHLEETVRPMRCSSRTIDTNLDAALACMEKPQPDLRLAAACVLRARAGARNLRERLTQAELFAYRNYGSPQSLMPRVLLVEDDEDRRLVLIEALDIGFHVDIVGNALEAWMTLTERRDYDVVICPLCLEGMSGADLIERLVQTHPEQARRILFLSNDTERAGHEEARVSRFDHRGVLRAPVDRHELRALIRRAAAKWH